MNTVYNIIIGMISLVFLDIIWLQGIAKSIYQKLFPYNVEFNVYAAIVVYFLIAIAIDFFIIKEGLIKNSTYFSIFAQGTLLGLVIYGVYDFTNLATLSMWNIRFTTLDIFWGMLATGISSCFVYFINMFFSK